MAFEFGSFDELADAAAKADQFDGEVTIDETVPDDFNDGQYKWHFGVRPDGAERDVQAYYTMGPRGYGSQVVTSLRKNMPREELAGKAPGRGLLLGTRGTWEKKHAQYKDRDTGEVKDSKNSPIVLLKYTGVASATPAFSEEDAVTLLNIMADKTPAEYKRGIMKLPFSKEIKEAVLGPAGAEFLLANGYAVSEEGILRATDKATALIEG